MSYISGAALPVRSGGFMKRACLFIGVLAIAARVHAAPVPTFSKDVAPIVFNHCASCHRAGSGRREE